MRTRVHHTEARRLASRRRQLCQSCDTMRSHRRFHRSWTEWQKRRVHRSISLLGSSLDDRIVGPRRCRSVNPIMHDSLLRFHAVLYRTLFRTLYRNGLIYHLHRFDHITERKGRGSYDTSRAPGGATAFSSCHDRVEEDHNRRTAQDISPSAVSSRTVP